jgi:hypothetical protein
MRRGHRWQPDRRCPGARDPEPRPGAAKLQEATTGADGAFRLGGLAAIYYKLLVTGPDGTWMLSGMVNGDPATATEFLAESPWDLPWTSATSRSASPDHHVS